MSVSYKELNRLMKVARKFEDFCKICENEALIDGRKGAAMNYRKTRSKLDTYVPAGSLQLSDITPEWVRSFNDWLIALGHEKGSISFYNRVLRAVYNQAVEKKLVKDAHPFDNVNTKTNVAHYPIKFENDERVSFEDISRDELLRRYKALAYKYNDILRKIRSIVPA